LKHQADGLCWTSAPQGLATTVGPCALCTNSVRPFTVYGTSACPDGTTQVYAGGIYQYGLGPKVDRECWKNPPSASALQVGPCARCVGNGKEVTINGQYGCPGGWTKLADGQAYSWSPAQRPSDQCWQRAPTNVLSQPVGPCSLCQPSTDVVSLLGATRCPDTAITTISGNVYFWPGGLVDNACWVQPAYDTTMSYMPCQLCVLP